MQANGRMKTGVLPVFGKTYIGNFKELIRR